VSGYAGGTAETARYDMVSSHATRHAEAVQVTFDPAQVTYGQLLQVFFSVAHDPTQLDRQGPDVGAQYRSALFLADDAQRTVAGKYIAQLESAKVYPGRIVTQLSPLEAFYPAEAYHQDYATLHPESPYIATFDLPKIAHLESMFPERFRSEPRLVDPRNARPRP
jgi:peptide-methionine (S)-S-oxide reductase